jgi:hypothetical protein
MGTPPISNRSEMEKEYLCHGFEFLSSEQVDLTFLTLSQRLVSSLESALLMLWVDCIFSHRKNATGSPPRDLVVDAHQPTA